MPLNPLISLSAAAPQINFAQDINQARQAELSGQAVQSGQNQLDQTAAVNNAYKQAVQPDGTVNRNQLFGLVAQGGYGSAVPGMAKTYAEADKASAGAMTDAQKVQLGHVQLVGQLLNNVTDDASYQKALGAAHANGINIAGAPTSYDPQWVNQTIGQAQTVTDHLDQLNKQQAAALAQNKFAYEQGNDAANRGVQIRGQDVTAGTAVRGQDLTASTTTRGQDMTSASEANAQTNRLQEYDPKSGIVLNKMTGQSTPVVDAQGQPVTKPSQNLTEGQASSLGFAARATDANNQLAKLEASGVNSPNRLQQAAGSLPLVGGALSAGVNSLPTALGGSSPDQQSYQQAKTNFVTAVLRKESGAAIGKDEYDTADKQYFPQPGDSASTIAQKARSRELTINAIAAQAGQGAQQIPSVISNTDAQYQAQPRAGQQGVNTTQQRAPSVGPGTIKQVGGKSYHFDGHGWTEVQ